MPTNPCCIFVIHHSSFITSLMLFFFALFLIRRFVEQFARPASSAILILMNQPAP